MVLANAYHLALRPGAALIRDLGGLHRFMGWDGPILTDSGGYQVFSLAALRKVRDDGVEFRSHVDGAPMFLTPEAVVQIQVDLGVDVIMVLDECVGPTGGPCGRRSVRRAARSIGPPGRSAARRRPAIMFAIVQGGTFHDLRPLRRRRLSRSISQAMRWGVSASERNEQ